MRAKAPAGLKKDRKNLRARISVPQKKEGQIGVDMYAQNPWLTAYLSRRQQ
jgi:hypothetical protein